MSQRLWPRPGTIIYVWFLGLLQHKGIVSNRRWNGKPMVIASAQESGGVAEIPWDAFTGGRRWFEEGYPSALPPYVVLYNARCLIGQPYSAMTANCEHFVYRCHGQRARSPQAATVFILGVFGLLFVAQP